MGHWTHHWVFTWTEADSQWLCLSWGEFSADAALVVSKEGHTTWMQEAEHSLLQDLIASWQVQWPVDFFVTVIHQQCGLKIESKCRHEENVIEIWKFHNIFSNLINYKKNIVIIMKLIYQEQTGTFPC